MPHFTYQNTKYSVSKGIWVEKPHYSKHFNISMVISTAICISLNILQMFELPEKAPVVFSCVNKHLFSLPLPQNNASLQME